MKTTHKQVLALLLAVALLLLLCAFAQIQQLKGTDSATLPETLAGQASETQSEDPTQHSEITEPQQAQHSETTEPQQAQYIGSEEGKNSLLWLRDKIDFSQTMFGMAYLGYVGGLFEEGFEAGFSAWLWETNAALLLEYPFIAEIDAEHIIGGAGHLYCIVPVDEKDVYKRQPLRSCSAAKAAPLPLTHPRSRGKQASTPARSPHCLPQRLTTLCSSGGTVNGTAGGR